MTQRSGLGCLFEIVETLVLTLVIFFVIQNFVAQPYRVQQQSMEDTLQPGEYVLVDKLTPRFNDYQRGEVVVFTPPDTFPQPDGTPFIKRVIGLPGEEVSIRDSSVFIDGQELDEPYVKGGITDPPPGQDRWVIPQGDYFVMGDNRSNSADSRVFGPIPRDVIIGRAWLRYWPLDTFGVLETPTYPGVDEAARRRLWLADPAPAADPALAAMVAPAVVRAQAAAVTPTSLVAPTHIVAAAASEARPTLP